MATNVTNTDAQLEGKTLQTSEDDQSITGLKTFSRLPDAPFAVVSGSPVVPNLNADTVDGYHAADILAAQLTRSTVILDNATIKALPTTPALIVPAPAAGFILLPIVTILMLKSGGVAYTNINADSFLYAAWEGTADVASGYVPNSSAIGLTSLSDLFGSTGGKFFRLRYPFEDDRGAPESWGIIPNTENLDANAASGLKLIFGNNGSGNLTGGDSANRLVVVTFSLTVALP